MIRKALLVALGTSLILPATQSVAASGTLERTTRLAAVTTDTDVRQHLMPSGDSYPFGLQSEWRRDITNAPVATNSKAQVAHLTQQVTSRYGGVAAFNAYQYNSVWEVVPSTQPKVDLKFDNCQKKTYVPSQLFQPTKQVDYRTGLTETVPGAFIGVPIPDDAVPSAGTDKSITIYSPSTDQLWEFWVTTKRADGWYACWGGRIDHVSSNPGWFQNYTGASASGLASGAGALSVADAQNGIANHALAVAIPEAARGVVSWPAQRTDGISTNPDALPEGTRLRLDPTFDVEKSNLHPIAKTVARTAQKYGLIVTDTSGAVAVVGESTTSFVASGQVDPWKALRTKPGAKTETPTYLVMQNFPWDRLQALPKDYGKM